MRKINKAIGSTTVFFCLFAQFFFPNAYARENIDASFYRTLKDQYEVDLTSVTAKPSDSDFALNANLLSCINRFGSLLSSEFGYLVRGPNNRNHLVVRRLLKVNDLTFKPIEGVLVYSEMGGVVEYPSKASENGPGAFSEVPTLAYSGVQEFDSARLSEQKRRLLRASLPSLQPDYNSALLTALEANYVFHVHRVLESGDAYRKCLEENHATVSCKAEKQKHDRAIRVAHVLESQKCAPKPKIKTSSRPSRKHKAKGGNSSGKSDALFKCSEGCKNLRGCCEMELFRLQHSKRDWTSPRKVLISPSEGTPDPGRATSVE